MFDAFPFDKWDPNMTTFWTFGNEGSAGTWVLTIVGFAVSLIALVGFVVTEKKKLDEHAARLRPTIDTTGLGQG